MTLPSVLLHDHLDGGLRPQTVIDLASDVGYLDLPTTDETSLASWFDQSDSGSLESYLQAFDHTIAVMQTADAIERVAYECAVDLSSDGVVYVESRFCPRLFTGGGLTSLQVCEAVANGFGRGERKTGIRWGLIVAGLRQFDWSMDLAKLAVSARDLGVVGFDLAGPEADHPPDNHLAAFRLIRESGLRLTIHAGEAGGPKGVRYIASAMDTCGAERIGHGIEIIHDCEVDEGEIVATGAVASRVRDRQLPLELCPASNLATNRLDGADHPIGMLYRSGFNVTISTDNRLMSNTSMSDEFEFASEIHGFDVDALATTTRRSLAAAFCDRPTKVSLWENLIAPAYRDSGAKAPETWTF